MVGKNVGFTTSRPDDSWSESTEEITGWWSAGVDDRPLKAPFQVQVRLGHATRA
jgi:hypothetical protein